MWNPSFEFTHHFKVMKYQDLMLHQRKLNEIRKRKNTYYDEEEEKSRSPPKQNFPYTNTTNSKRSHSTQFHNELKDTKLNTRLSGIHLTVVNLF